MTLEVVKYIPSLEQLWDNFCKTSINATFLHSRRFLNYHQNRFSDKSVIIKNKEEIVALFPAAVSPNNPKIIISHPGITYGGILHTNNLRGVDILEILTVLLNHYSLGGYRELQYKCVPYIYTAGPAQDDLFALYYLKANKFKCNLASVIDLKEIRQRSKRRVRSYKKASKYVSISQEDGYLMDIWSILEENLSRKYKAIPVHSLGEILHLKSIFSNEIISIAALVDGVVVAGVIVFKFPKVMHIQYIASNEIGNKFCALDAVFELLIKLATSEGLRYFDFGTSNETDGSLNPSLHNYKCEYGGGGVAYEQFSVPINL